MYTTLSLLCKRLRIYLPCDMALIVHEYMGCTDIYVRIYRDWVYLRVSHASLPTMHEHKVSFKSMPSGEFVMISTYIEKVWYFNNLFDLATSVKNHVNQIKQVHTRSSTNPPYSDKCYVCNIPFKDGIRKVTRELQCFNCYDRTEDVCCAQLEYATLMNAFDRSNPTFRKVSYVYIEDSDRDADGAGEFARYDDIVECTDCQDDYLF